MIQAPEAVEKASDSIRQLIPNFADLQPHVEEIQRSPDDKFWVITFRADNPRPAGDVPNVFFPYVEKVVLITMDSGELTAIRNRSYE